MACLTRKPRSPYWMIKFRDALGRIVMRSSKQTKHSEARKTADRWEDAAKKARSGELTQAATLKILGELMEQTTGEELKIESVKDFLTKWLGARSGSTAKRYKPIIEGFIGSLSEKRQGAGIGTLTPTEIERFRDAEVRAGKGATTANFAVSILRAALNSARRKGLTLSNPAEAIDELQARAEEREVFTDEEISSLLKRADEEWRGMILTGLYTGLRLNDAAHLEWRNVNFEQGTLGLTAKKTGEPIVIALHGDLLAYLNGLERGIERAPLFPSLHGVDSGSAGGLSNAFARIMEKAKVTVTLGAEKKGKGRRFRSKGFHSLRHTLVSRLANADVSPDVRKAIVGHADDAAHARYTHLAIETQRRAIAKLGSTKGS